LLDLLLLLLVVRRELLLLAALLQVLPDPESCGICADAGRDDSMGGHVHAQVAANGKHRMRCKQHDVGCSTTMRLSWCIS
jgi:hypothetical protein